MPLIPQKKTIAELEIETLFQALKTISPDNDEYDRTLDRITKIQKVQDAKRVDRVSPDTLIVAATNLIGILMILKHEELNIITSKAMSLAPRLR